jgi:hypothetical protein
LIAVAGIVAAAAADVGDFLNVARTKYRANMEPVERDCRADDVENVEDAV